MKMEIYKDGHIVSNAQYATVDPPISARFEPQPDITAYELAILLPYLNGLTGCRQSQFDAMLPNVRRHLVRTDLK